VSRVAGVGCSRRSCKSENAIGGNARLAIGIAVGRVAGVSSAGRRRSDERKCAVGRDTLHTFRVGVRRVAGILRGGGFFASQRTSQRTSGGGSQREKEGAVHDGMRSSLVNKGVWEVVR
jgi:hypothetical protein